VDVLALSFVPELETITKILTVAVGLGLVIFFHELGHFAVAKWCDVNVERFSIGFGPILFRWKWGETEYAFSSIPFGGYVKMLGQDDMDPNQQTSEEIAEDPRSYPAKSVRQRMAIISAGVIMNIITGSMFFVAAFQMGVEAPPNEVGHVQVGMPAWEHGLRPGDRITEINGKEIHQFTDIILSVALSSGPLTIKGIHADDERYTVTIEPVEPSETQTRRQIGVGYARSTMLAMDTDDEILVEPDSPASLVSEQLQPGDGISLVEVARVNGVSIGGYAELKQLFAEHRAEPLELSLSRRREDGSQGADATVTLAPQKFRVLGMQMDIGKISAIRANGPGAAAGLRIGDRITAVDGRNVGDDLDAMRLPDLLENRQGEQVTLTILREVEGSEPETLDVIVTPTMEAAWSEPPNVPETPLAIPALGVAYQITPTVVAIEPGGPADEAGIKVGESVTRIEYVLSGDAPEELYGQPPYELEMGDENWPYAFWRLQHLPVARIKLEIEAADSTREVELAPRDAVDWYVPDDRGLVFDLKTIELKATSVVNAVVLGLSHTTNTIKQIYLTLRGLVTGDVSPRELQGPINIAKIAYRSADVGLASFLLFLGLISVNLAVINFLPIPVLDGGHMVFLGWEAVTRRPPNERIVLTATYCGLAFVIGLMVFVICLDIFVQKS
jgi:regulator of sigma E protease